MFVAQNLMMPMLKWCAGSLGLNLEVQCRRIKCQVIQSYKVTEDLDDDRSMSV